MRANALTFILLNLCVFALALVNLVLAEIEFDFIGLLIGFLRTAILALTAGYVASHTKKVSIALLAGVVLAYQVAGGLFEWAYTSSFAAAVQDFKLGLPGMLLQIVGGYLFIKYLLKK